MPDRRGQFIPGNFVLTPSGRAAVVVRVDAEQRSAVVRWACGELAELRESHLRPLDLPVDLEIDP